VEKHALAVYQDAAEQYQTYLDQTLQDPQGFTVDNDSKADWALRKLAEARRRLQERQAFVDMELARLQAWQAKLDAEDARLIRYLERLLATYFAQLHAQGRLGRKKSYRLPHGQLTTHQVPTQWVVDEAELLTWAEPLGLVRINKVSAWKEIKARLIAAASQPGAAAIDMTTGEFVPGVTVKVPAGEAFHAKTEDDTDYGRDI
jgi:Bacteriophage Mu Gam like protein